MGDDNARPVGSRKQSVLASMTGRCQCLVVLEQGEMDERQ